MYRMEFANLANPADIIILVAYTLLTEGEFQIYQLHAYRNES